MTLEVTNLRAGYGGMEVVHDISFTVGSGEIVSMLGRNGAGKSTTLMAVAGVLRKARGTVAVDGQVVEGPAHKRANNGVGIVLEGRSVFPNLTVRRNIELGDVAVDDVVAMFPELRARLSNQAGSLSGGEQQMLSLGRIISRKPKVLLLDEIDFGLAPVVSLRLFDRLREVAAGQQMAILLVEQHMNFAARVADRALVMNEGRLLLEMPAHELVERQDEVERIYLGGVLT